MPSAPAAPNPAPPPAGPPRTHAAALPGSVAGGVPAPATRAKDRSSAVLIFGFLLACYLLTYTGVIDSSDGLSMFATTESAVRTGSWDSNQLLWMGNQQGNLGVGGNLYSRKGLGMVLLGLPLVWLGKLWPAVGMAHAALLLNPIFTAWTGALLFRTGRRLGWSRPTAAATALLFGLGTLAWPYTQGYFSDPLCAWGLFAAAYGLLAYAQSGRKLYLFGAGAAWGLAYLTRTINLITLPLYLVGLFFVLETALRAPRPAPWRDRLRAAFFRDWRPVVSFFIPVVAAGLLSLWWNWARFGSLFDTGYVATESFSGDWLAGLYGLTVGPARGLVWYSPILLLALPGAWVCWRNHRRILVLSLLIVGLHFVVYAKWYMWSGGYSWGPRFLVPAVPFLALIAGAGWGLLVEQKAWGWAGRLLAWLLALVSVGVQWLGMAVPYSLVQDQLARDVQPLFAPQTFTDPRLSPLALQWQYLTPQHIQFAWWRGASDAGTPLLSNIDWLGLAMPLIGVAVGAWLLWRLLRSPEANPLRWDHPLRNGLYAFALLAITLAVLTYAGTALANPEVTAVAARIAANERRGDAVLQLRPDQTQTFANAYRGNLPVYGFFAQQELSADDATWLERLRTRYDRLWVLPDGTPPERSGWELPLRTQDFLLVDERVTGPTHQRVALYAPSPRQQLQEAGLGMVFGDPAAGAAVTESPVTEANGWMRLEGYALTTETRPGDAVLLTLLWRSLQPVAKDYHVFVHLLDDQGNKIAQADGQPVQWLRPTTTWQPGERIVDHYGLQLAPTLPAGTYTIAVGLYDPVSGQRLPVSAGPSSFAIELGPIVVR